MGGLKGKQSQEFNHEWIRSDTNRPAKRRNSDAANSEWRTKKLVRVRRAPPDRRSKKMCVYPCLCVFCEGLTVFATCVCLRIGDF